MEVKPETMTLNCKDYDAVMNSTGRLWRRLDLMSKALMGEADRLLPKRETAQFSPVSDFGGFCYMAAAIEVSALFKEMGELKSQALLSYTDD